MHQAGKAIAFGMDQAIERLVIERIAQGQRARQTLRRKTSASGRRLRVEQAHRDQAFGIEIAGANILAVIALDIDHRAGRQRLGGGVHLDLVGKYPGRAGAHAAAFLGLEADGGMGGHGIPVGKNAPSVSMAARE